MRKLFIQFYLLLFVCFLVMTLLVGLVYKCRYRCKTGPPADVNLTHLG